MKSWSLIIGVIFLILFGCSKNNNSDGEVLVPVVEAELVYYVYELNREDQTFIWDYKVKFTNTSKVDAFGFAAVYHRDVNGDITFQSPHPEGENCPIILAGEECIYSFYESGEYDPNLVEPDQKLVFEKGEYFFEE